MKPNIHPKVMLTKVHCGCGNEFETMATVSELRLELCGACHPFFTGKKRNLAIAGRVQRFEQKYKAVGSTPAAAPAKRKPVKMPPPVKALKPVAPPKDTRPPRDSKK